MQHPTRARVIVLLALALAPLTACGTGADNTPRGEPGSKAAPRTLAFGWKAGQSFDVIHTAVRDGQSLELSTRGKVTAEGADQLRVTFDAPKLDADAAKLVGKGQPFEHQDAWPTLIVKRDTGELVSIDGADAAVKEVAARRWGIWTSPIGFDLEPGTQRTYATEVEAGDGLVLPVTMTEMRSETPQGLSRITMMRVYVGDPTKKLWQASLADSGAPKATVDAVQKVSREEKLVAETDPRTLNHARMEDSSTTTVTSLQKKVEKTEVHASSDTWQFRWD